MTDDEVSRLDNAFLVFSGVFTTIYSLVGYYITSSLLQKVSTLYIIVFLFLVPLYYGYYRGVIVDNSSKQRYLGWCILFQNAIAGLIILPTLYLLAQTFNDLWILFLEILTMILSLRIDLGLIKRYDVVIQYDSPYIITIFVLFVLMLDARLREKIMQLTYKFDIFKKLEKILIINENIANHRDELHSRALSITFAYLFVFLCPYTLLYITLFGFRIIIYIVQIVVTQGIQLSTIFFLVIFSLATYFLVYYTIKELVYLLMHFLRRRKVNNS